MSIVSQLSRRVRKGKLVLVWIHFLGRYSYCSMVGVLAYGDSYTCESKENRSDAVGSGAPVEAVESPFGIQ